MGQDVARTAVDGKGNRGNKSWAHQVANQAAIRIVRAMKDTLPKVCDLVLIGGGHSHVDVLKSFGMKPVPGTRLTVICRDVLTPYSGMLPGYVAGHYTHDECHIDLEPLAGFAGARFIHDEVVGLDPVKREVMLKGRPPIPYDTLSINIGSSPALGETRGAAEFVTPVKPIAGFVNRWERLLARVGQATSPVRIGVVGAGAGGVELILAMHWRLTRELRRTGGSPGDISFQLIQGDAEILPTQPEKIRAMFERTLSDRGIEVFRDCRIARVEENCLIAQNGAQFDLDEILWCTRAGAARWLRETGLELNDRGFINVDDTLQSISHPGIFAVGDIANMVNHPREKAGVFAVRQGPPLTENLKRVVRGKRAKKFKPQSSFLSLISTGDKYAAGSKSGFVREGRWLWWWKDRIDRAFMDKFNNLPAMILPKPDISGAAQGLAEELVDPMKCAGCGSKVGAGVLATGLGGLQQPGREDILLGLNARDDSAVLLGPGDLVQVQSVDHLRALTDDPYLAARIAANHALGDVWAMGAEPQSALAIVTLPPLSERLQRRTLGEVMAGGVAAFAPEGAVIIGGHTAEGPEMAVGFAVSGLALPGKILSKGGMAPGDALILTKPIGTGVLFAARMRGQARGPWITAVLDGMVQESGTAARLLSDRGASAMTDVTGFGLAGHALEMAQASGMSIRLSLADIPAYDGAVQMAAAGISSSLFDANRKADAHMASEGTGDNLQTPEGKLLFDPQTAGGLLASVPAEQAEEAVEALRAAGYAAAAIIGRVRKGEGQARLTVMS